MSWFFENINKINKTFNQIHQEKRGTTLVNIIRNDRGEITTDTKEIQRVVRKY